MVVDENNPGWYLRPPPQGPLPREDDDDTRAAYSLRIGSEPRDAYAAAVGTVNVKNLTERQAAFVAWSAEDQETRGLPPQQAAQLQDPPLRPGLVAGRTGPEYRVDPNAANRNPNLRGRSINEQPYYHHTRFLLSTGAAPGLIFARATDLEIHGSALTLSDHTGTGRWRMSI